jgi:hypothetical protein
MALLIPLTAIAKKPVPIECKIAADSPVATNNSFDVVVRPGSGQWFRPTVTVEVIVPVIPTFTGPNTYSQTVTQTFAGQGQPNVARASFFIPDRLSIDLNGSVNVFATVSQPVSRGRSIESQCETTTTF